MEVELVRESSVWREDLRDTLPAVGRTGVGDFDRFDVRILDLMGCDGEFGMDVRRDVVPGIPYTDRRNSRVHGDTLRMIT